MDNYGSSSPHRYPDPYGYRNNPPVPYPPPGSDPAAPPPYPYPSIHSHSFNYTYPPPPGSSPSGPHFGPLDYSRPPPPVDHSHYPPSPDYGHPHPPANFNYSRPPADFSHPPPSSYSAPLPYPYPYPYQAPPGIHGPSQPAHLSSFQYGSSHYPSQPVDANSSYEVRPLVHSRTNSFSSLSQYGSPSAAGGTPLQASNSFNSSQSSAYPPLDDLMSNVHLSDNHQTPHASPSAPVVQHLGHSISIPNQDRKEDFYGHPNNSFSGWESSYSGRVDSSKLSSVSGSFNDSIHSQSVQIVPSHNVGSLKVLLLHGNLDIWVHEARNLPNMDMFHKTLGDVFGRLPGNMGNKIEGTMSNKITSDPYVTISISNAVIGRTFVISNSENPVWKQHFHVPVAHNAAELHFVVKDSDVVGSQIIGLVSVPVDQIYSGEKVEGTYPILNSSGKPCKQGAVLSLSVQYIPIEKLSIYCEGVGAGPDYTGVPGTYFPLRKGGIVTLYQDAHVPDGCLPNVILDRGMYVHGKCWRDIFDAIRQARRLIYITGWSVWHKVQLVRDAGNPSGYTLGDLLRSKSQEGVRVLLLIWDDPTSRNILGYKTVSNATFLL